MTNGEMLRQKTDEELLEFFFGSEAYTISFVQPQVVDHGNARIVMEKSVRLLDWMKEECVD